MSKLLVILIITVVYMAGTAVIGMWFTRRQKGLGEYFLAGKAVHPIALGIAAAAGTMSGWAFIGSPGMAYEVGIGFMTVSVFLPMTTFFPWFFLARKLRTLADTHDCMTIPDVVHARFNSETLTLLCSIGALFGLIAYTATQFMALAYLTGVVFGFSFEASTLITVAVIGAYSVLGGQRGIIWTNVMQGVVMLVASLGGFFFAWTLIGPGAAYSGMKSISPKLVSFFGNIEIGWWISRLIISLLGANGRMAFLPRFFMIKDLKGLKWPPVLTPLSTALMGMLTWSVPFVYLGLQAQGLAPILIRTDECMPAFLMMFAPSILAGILIAGALAASMSTAALYMNLGAATLVKDLGMRHLRLNFKNPVAAARVATVIFTLVSMVLAMTAREYVMMMGVAATAIWGASISAVLTIGMLWKGTTKQGAIAGVILGLIFSVGFQILSVYEIYKLPYGIVPGAVGIVLAFLTILIVSLWTERSPMDEKMEKVVSLPLIARRR